jgi:ABC-2 family transporter protein
MQQIIAIAILSIRNAIRSKVVLCLLALLLVVITVVPLTIKSDGTAAGLIQILVSYTLGIAGFILAMTTLWAGSAAVSAEINNKTIQMSASKPVTKMQLWAGKWIGLNIMNTVLLIICGLSTFGVLKWHLHPDRLGNPEMVAEADQILAAREVRRPILPDFESNAENKLRALMEIKPLPEGITQQEVLQRLIQEGKIDFQTAQSTQPKKWEFKPVLFHSETKTVSINYRFSSSRIDQDSVKCHWRVGTPDQPDLFELKTTSVPRTQNHFDVTLDSRWENAPLVVTFSNESEAESTLLFDPNEGLVMLIPRGGFAGNYVRAIAIMGGQLSFLTALGVTAGCLFSLPVATFFSLFVLLLIQMGSYVHAIASANIVFPWQVSTGQVMSWSAIALMIPFKMISLLLSPLTELNVLASLSTGRLINYQWVINGFFLQGIVYSLLLGWIAAFALNRRELALPS